MSPFDKQELPKQLDVYLEAANRAGAQPLRSRCVVCAEEIWDEEVVH